MDSSEYPLSLFERLPYDVICIIFLHYAPPTIHLWHTLEPWTLASVCSTWRQIALETPALWNNLIINLRIKSKHWDREMEVIKLCLSRAGQSLISLDLRVEDERLEDYEAVGMLKGVLQPYFGQLRKLSLSAGEVSQGWILTLEPGTLDALESISITFGEERSLSNLFNPRFHHLDNRFESDVTAFRKARSLRAAIISSGFATCDPRIFHFPWTRLTQLDFIRTILTFKESHEVLRQCMNLISLKIGIQTNEECNQYMLSMPDTFLPCLESLEVFSFSTFGVFGMFLTPFDLPTLKNLTVMSDLGAAWAGMLSARCLCHLERVRFWGLQPQDVLKFIKDAPLVEEWSFHTFVMGSFHEMIAAIGCGDLVPALRVFDCDVRVADAMLLPMLKTRGKFVDRSPSQYATLESIVVHGAPPGRLRQSLDELGDRGVGIAFR